MGRENVAVAKGIWTAGTFVSGAGTYYYNLSKKGAQDGVGNWGLCGWPFNLSVSDVQADEVHLAWEHPGGAQTFKIKYREGGNGGWDDAIYSYNGKTHKILDGLSPNTQYAWAVEVNCGSGWGTMQSSNSSFTMLGAACNLPTGITTAIAQPTQAKLDWADDANAKKWRIRYRVVGAGSWTNTSRTGGGPSHKWITGLTANTNYEWQIKTVCQHGPATGTAWSSSQMFSTPTSKWDEVTTSADLADNVLRVFPNPATNGAINLALDLPEGLDVRVVVTNMLGAEAAVQRISTAANNITTIDMSNQPSGLYVVRVVGENVDLVEKVMVQ